MQLKKMQKSSQSLAENGKHHVHWVKSLPKNSFMKLPMIVAHRGASGDAPENTLAAFELAWEQGADAIEGDFRLTKDGVIVCIHDEDTERVGDKKLRVAESPLQVLKTVDVGSYHGAEFSKQVIPTLEEVIATIPEGKKIFIEVKCGCEIVPILIKQLRTTNLNPNQIIIIAFDAKVIEECKATAPEFEANWLNDYEEHCDLLTIIPTLVETGADGLSSNNEQSKALVDSVLELGLSYHAGWTMDDVGLARQLLNWGASSITTDNPGKLREKLSE